MLYFEHFSYINEAYFFSLTFSILLCHAKPLKSIQIFCVRQVDYKTCFNYLYSSLHNLHFDYKLNTYFYLFIFYFFLRVNCLRYILWTVCIYYVYVHFVYCFVYFYFNLNFYVICSGFQKIFPHAQNCVVNKSGACWKSEINVLMNLTKCAAIL